MEELENNTEVVDQDETEEVDLLEAEDSEDGEFEDLVDEAGDPDFVEVDDESDDDDEEGDLEFDGEEEEPEEVEETDDEPEEEPEDQAKADDQSGELSFEEEVKTRVLAEYTPGTKEFFDASAADAKAEVEKEFGEFDEFDPAHISRFHYYVNKAQVDRNKEYEAAVAIVKTERETRVKETQKQQKLKEVEAKIESILPTPELQKDFDALLQDMSKNNRGEFLVMMEELAQGKLDKFVETARKVTGPQHREVINKSARRTAKPASARRKGNRELVGSDILGY